MEVIRESLNQVNEIQHACSLVDALVDNVTEPMRRWLQETIPRDGVGEESAGMSRSEEVANTCALANEWAEAESWAEHAIQESMDNYQPLETEPESDKY